MSDLTGRRLGEFLLLRHLGSGGMADVFVAEQTSLQRQVAVKVMKPKLIAHSGQDMLARFKQEAMMAAGLNHPNIVQVYTIGQEENLHYIAQEYVQGKDLASIIRDKGRPDLSSALHVIRQVASALKASGQAGIVHRDIKPENILVTKKGEVKVADFGLAQLGETSGVDDSGVTMGTPLYMSPEQVSGKELDPRSDVYSFGVTCYQLLCGETPFKGSTPVAIAMQHLKTAPPPLKEKNPALPDILCRVVHRMMAKRRTLRYQSADEVLEDLKKLITAHKQGRSLELVKLPRLEELEKLTEEERLRQLKSGGAPDADVSGKAPPAAAAPAKASAAVASAWAQKELAKAAKAPKSEPVPIAVVDDDEELPPRERSAPPNDSIDLTPAVDVTFQLLIFFMVTASFSMQKAFDVPAAKNSDAVSMNVRVELPTEGGVKVEVDSDNNVFVEGKKATTYTEILELLKSERKGVTDLDLDLDPDSIHEMRIMVIDAATQAGFTKVRNRITEI